MPPEVVKEMEAQFKKEIGAATGYNTYEEMRIGINRELGRLNFIPDAAD